MLENLKYLRLGIKKGKTFGQYKYLPTHVDYDDDVTARTRYYKREISARTAPFFRSREFIDVPSVVLFRFLSIGFITFRFPFFVVLL